MRIIVAITVGVAVGVAMLLVVLALSRTLRPVADMATCTHVEMRASGVRCLDKAGPPRP